MLKNTKNTDRDTIADTKTNKRYVSLSQRENMMHAFAARFYIDAFLHAF